jgi:hypothetical protein
MIACHYGTDETEDSAIMTRHSQAIVYSLEPYALCGESFVIVSTKSRWLTGLRQAPESFIRRTESTGTAFNHTGSLVNKLK